MLLQWYAKSKNRRNLADKSLAGDGTGSRNVRSIWWRPSGRHLKSVRFSRTSCWCGGWCGGCTSWMGVHHYHQEGGSLVL